MRVVATRDGIYPNGTRRRKGAEFDWDDKDWERLKGLSKLPSWVVPESNAESKTASPKDKPAKAGTKDKPAGGKETAATDKPGAPTLPGT
jgi:hypothetical protein